MISEVGLFLGGLLGSILTFASAMSVVKHHDKDFAGIDKGAYALIRVVLGAYDSTHYTVLREDPMLLAMTTLFAIITVIFFLSMLVAQLSCAYSSVYDNMVGYARLERADTIVEMMRIVPKRRWQVFVDS